MNIAQLERDLEAKRTEGLALLAKTCTAADAANREWTDEERTALKAIETDAVALKNTLQRAVSDREIGSTLERLQIAHAPQVGGRTVLHPPTRLLSMGEQFVSADQYKFFKEGKHRTTSAWRSESIELLDHRLGMRAATLTEDPASGGGLVMPQYLPGIQPVPTPRLVVADLLASGTTDSNLVAYMREKSFVNAAATVLEGAVKPESTLVFEAAQDAVRKIATWLPVSEEMLEDVAQIRSYIDARLRLFVGIEEEDQLLNGTGVAPDLLGLRLRPGLAADVARVNPESNADAILRQIMAIFATSYLMPDGITMNPADWATTLLTKTAQGAYLTGGPFQPIQTTTLWGLPVANTPSITAGVSLVGAYQTGAQVFRKGGIRVEASNSHADFFIKNLVAIRAEERLALAVYRPGAFGEVTGLGPVTTP